MWYWDFSVSFISLKLEPETEFITAEKQIGKYKHVAPRMNYPQESENVPT